MIALVPCPRECGATGLERSNFEDRYTGRYEPACPCCADDGELTYVAVLARALEGYRIPAGLPAEWSVAIYAEAMRLDPECDGPEFARYAGLELPETQLSIAAE